MNPQTKLPHPENRIRSAMEEAKVRLNDFKKAEDQLEEVITQLRPIMPISLEKATIDMHIPAASAARARTILHKYGKVLREMWGQDGSLSVQLQLPAGMQEECTAELQSITHGGVDIKLNK
jgi:ribosome maturation protein SDO1